MHKTVILNVVGLTPRLLHTSNPATSMPHLNAFAAQGRLATIDTIIPAVTCSVQTTFLTGCLPSEHGIVGNGWYFRDEHEIRFWRQSNALIQRPPLWERASELDPGFTCANLFWWFNMYSSAHYTVTPRPIYPADGRKLPDIYTTPTNLRTFLQRELGQFPLFNFWGPNSSLPASAWIANAAMLVDQRYNPTLTLLYLPHLDYCLQRHGPDIQRIAQDLRDIDALCGQLIDYYRKRDVRIMILSEYGITNVARPVHINRELRKRGLLAVREELGREMLDAGASRAFAVADHQVAHVYVNDLSRMREVRSVLEATPGIAQVLDAEGKRAMGLAHERSGDFVVIAEPAAWFTYYYWLDDAVAPDYARTVDIHRKPGYDPAELFLDPHIRWPALKIGWKLLQSRLGLRTLLDVITLDATLVRGSHGRINADRADCPLLITTESLLLHGTDIAATDVYELALAHLLAP